MRIGLITIYQVPNFGSVLQTYATQILLEELRNVFTTDYYSIFYR